MNDPIALPTIRSLRPELRLAATLWLALLTGLVLVSCGGGGGGGPVLSSGKAITSFVFTNKANASLGTDISGSISRNVDGSGGITLTLPYGTDRSALVTSFASTGAMVKVGSTVQVSASTPNNFDSSVLYTVTAADGSNQTYTVSIVSPLVSCNSSTIGVYYYPGWSPYIKGISEPDPWLAIKAYPEREPLLGWYNDAKRETLEQQLSWMAEVCVRFVTFDWYWENGGPVPETSVQAYLQSAARSRVQYNLMWANDNKEPRTITEWTALVDYWLNKHMQNPEYLRIDGKPVLTIFSPDMLRDQAKQLGLSVAAMLDMAREKAKAMGLPGIYFVLCVAATDYWVYDFVPKSGVDALTGYNYHFGVAGDADKRTTDSHNFEELDSDYQMQWQWLMANSNLPYFVPMTSGWDKRPWGGSTDPLHDNSVSTPDSFERHLRNAKAVLQAYPEKTKGIGMICCWNEYGEGSYIEPTKLYGMKYLQRLRSVFGVPVE